MIARCDICDAERAARSSLNVFGYRYDPSAGTAVAHSCPECHHPLRAKRRGDSGESCILDALPPGGRVSAETEFDAEATAPNPGSDEARQRGCTCPVLDNGRGQGRGDGQWWVRMDCPLHGTPENGEVDDDDDS